VLSAAEKIARRAISHAEKIHIDPAVAANLLEETAATVSRAMRPEKLIDRPIQDLESYLFRAFLRRMNRKHRRDLLKAKELHMYAMGWRNSIDLREMFEHKVVIDEFLMQCDPVMRDMVCRRIEGFSWKEIGRSHRISSHAAESRFGKTLKKLRRKLGLR
jgi:DNA-directed RNA polymerase specialized sigma24 family protein